MKIIKSSKTMAAVATAVCFGCLIWLMSVKSVNSSLEASLEKQKLASEALLSEKLLLEKDLDKMRNQLAAIRGTNGELQSLLTKTSSKLVTQESEYNRLKKENLSLAQVRKQRQELQTLQIQLENDLQALTASYAQLQGKNDELTSRVAFLQERNQLLTDDLNRALFASLDQSQIHAVKGKKDVITVRAKQARKLNASFEVPSNLNNLSFRIKDPAGNEINQSNGVVASVVTPSSDNILASSDTQMVGHKHNRVEFTYTSKRKLKAGVYTVEVLNENLYITSLKLKLR